MRWCPSFTAKKKKKKKEKKRKEKETDLTQPFYSHVCQRSNFKKNPKFHL